MDISSVGSVVTLYIYIQERVGGGGLHNCNPPDSMPTRLRFLRSSAFHDAVT
jgi:hypothetical protein